MTYEDATPATLANMRAVAAKDRVGSAVAWSPTTGEQCSANPGDYFAREEGDPLRDSEGNSMILVYFPRQVIDALTWEPLGAGDDSASEELVPSGYND